MDYKGLNVPKATELRQPAPCPRGLSTKSIKNTLAQSGESAAPGWRRSSRSFEGTTAIAYTGDDAVALAKALTAFMKKRADAVDQGGGRAGPGDHAGGG